MRFFSSPPSLVKLVLLMFIPGLTFAWPFHPPAKKTIFQAQSQQQNSPPWRKTPPFTSNARDLYTALSAEFSYLYGNSQDSLKSYWDLLQKTSNPQVAERLSELAFASRNLTILKKLSHWQKSHPLVNLKNPIYIQWQEAYLKGDHPYLFQHLKEILIHADAKQKSIIFESLITLLMQAADPRPIARYAPFIHEVAPQYPRHNEVISTDVLYSAFNHDKAHLEKALSLLQDIYPEINQSLAIILGIINHVEPQALISYFQNLPSSSYRESWLKLYLQQLATQEVEPYLLPILKKALKTFPNDPYFYARAGFNSVYLHHEVKEFNNYYRKAYQLSSKKEKPSIAIMAAQAALLTQQNVTAYQWASLLPDNSIYDYDKKAILGFIAVNKKDLTKIEHYRRELLKFNKTSGGTVFSEITPYELQLKEIVLNPDLRQALKELKAFESTVVKALKNARAQYLLQYIYVHEAQIAYKLSDLKENEAALRRAIALHPTPILINNLGYLLLQSDNIPLQKEGSTLVRQAYQADPRSPEIIDSMGYAFLRTQSPEKALPFFKSAYHMTGNLEVLSHLIEALWLTGQKKEARALLHHGLNKNPNNPARLYLEKHLHIE